MGDEPTGNLDSRTDADVIALLRKLNVDRSLTVVLRKQFAPMAEFPA